jgi:hypothetical protein
MSTKTHDVETSYPKSALNIYIVIFDPQWEIKVPIVFTPLSLLIALTIWLIPLFIIIGKSSYGAGSLDRFGKNKRSNLPDVPRRQRDEVS